VTSPIHLLPGPRVAVAAIVCMVARRRRMLLAPAIRHGRFFPVYGVEACLGHWSQARSLQRPSRHRAVAYSHLFLRSGLCAQTSVAPFLRLPGRAMSHSSFRQLSFAIYYVMYVYLPVRADHADVHRLCLLPVVAIADRLFVR